MALSEVRVSNGVSIPLAVIRRQVRPSELAKVVPEGCGVVWDFVRARGLQAGRNVAVYWDGAIRLEVGVEMAAPFEESSTVFRSVTPSGPAVSVSHFGPYPQLRAAHSAIAAYVSANNLELAGPSWEIYGHWQNEWNADPSLIRTDVFYQLKP